MDVLYLFQAALYWTISDKWPPSKIEQGISWGNCKLSECIVETLLIVA